MSIRILAVGALLAVLAGGWSGPAGAFLMEPLDRGLVAVSMELTGDSVVKVKEEASLQAVRACVGRVFWGRELLIAQELLTNYLEKNHSRYVRGVETLKTDFTAGRPVLQLRVYVDYWALLHDLREKRFILVPRPRPYFKVFLAEKLGDEFATYATGREELNNALKDRNLYPYVEVLERPPSDVDVLSDPVLFDDAVIACERHGIELLVSGTSVTTRDAQKELYYDTYYFYTTNMKVALVRVDTGDVLARAEARGTASHTDEQRAIDLSIARAADLATGKLIETYEKVWGPMVLDRANYHLLLTGITPETLGLVRDSLAGFRNDSKVFLRQSYDRTAVLNVAFPGKREELIKHISTMAFPTLSIIPPVAVDARLAGEATMSITERTEIGKRIGLAPPEGQSGTYNYIVTSRVGIRAIDRATERTIVEVSASAQATGLDLPDVALESLRRAISQGLSTLNQEFPPFIDVVVLREAAYTVRLEEELAGTAKALSTLLARESSLASIDTDVGRDQSTIRLRYAEPKSEDENLLGKDPLLPDERIISSTRSNYLEIQVGE